MGGGTDVTTQEGYDSNPYTNISPYWRVTPSYGFSQYQGIDHLKAEVWVETKIKWVYISYNTYPVCCG